MSWIKAGVDLEGLGERSGKASRLQVRALVLLRTRSPGSPEDSRGTRSKMTSRLCTSGLCEKRPGVWAHWSLKCSHLSKSHVLVAKYPDLSFPFCRMGNIDCAHVMESWAATERLHEKCASTVQLEIFEMGLPIFCNFSFSYSCF